MIAARCYPSHLPNQASLGEGVTMGTDGLAWGRRLPHPVSETGLPRTGRGRLFKHQHRATQKGRLLRRRKTYPARVAKICSRYGVALVSTQGTHPFYYSGINQLVYT
jgi:hypothetical protein